MVTASSDLRGWAYVTGERAAGRDERGPGHRPVRRMAPVCTGVSTRDTCVAAARRYLYIDLALWEAWS